MTSVPRLAGAGRDLRRAARRRLRRGGRRRGARHAARTSCSARPSTSPGCRSGGRLPEAMGEDPYLTGRLAVGRDTGHPGPPCHLDGQALHRQQRRDRPHRLRSTGRAGARAVNTVVGERALQEIYYPPFKAAVQRGGAGAVMGSYNRLNGTYACQHPHSCARSRRSGAGTASWPPTSCTQCATRSPPPTPGWTAWARPPGGPYEGGFHLRPHSCSAAGRDRDADPLRHLRRRTV